MNISHHSQYLIYFIPKDDETLVREAIDWSKSTSQTFKQDNFRPVQVLASGEWGRQIRIFWDNFHGVSAYLMFL